MRIYLLDSLPEDVTQAVIDFRTLAAAKKARSESKPSSPSAGQAIPARAHEIGLAKLELHGAWRVHRLSAQAKTTADAAFLAAYNSGQSHPAVFKILGRVTKHQLYRWDRALKEAGGDYRALCDHRGWAQAQGAQGRISPEAQEILTKIYLDPERPSIALAYRGMCAVLAERGLPLPTESTTRRFIQRYSRENHDLVVLMREGEKALADKVGPYITRDAGQLAVGDVLVADGHRLNFDCIHPFTGKPARMCLILWLDWASRMPVGWEIMPEENTTAISAALFMAIKNLGQTPKVVYLDNGRAFRAKFFSSAVDDELPMQTRGLYQRLGIAVQYSRPYQARTKIVERFFGTFDAQCARLLPSYRGASVADKPAYLARNEKFHRARHNNAVPTIAQATEIIQAYFGWYGQQPHEGLDGRTPLEVFAAGRGPGVDMDALAWDFLWRKEVRPSRCRVRLANVEYESDALYGLNEPVLAMYAWADMSQIWLFDQRGQALGQARPVAALHPVARHLGGQIDLEKIKEANKRQAKLKKDTMRLAREAGVSDEALGVFPHVALAREMVPLGDAPPERPAPAPGPVELSAEERRQIEAAQRQFEARRRLAPAYARPAHATPLDRYGYLFDLKVFQNIDLVVEDQEFMAAYEASDEYKITGRRFAQLRRLAQVEAETASLAARRG